jgi:hypothetical protein
MEGSGKIADVHNKTWRREDVRGSRVMAPWVLILEADAGEWSPSCSDRFNSEKRAPGTHLIWGPVGPTAGLEAVQNGLIPAPVFFTSK